MKAWLLALAACGLYGQSDAKQTVTEFMGHKVILVEPKRDSDGFAEESYQLCLDSVAPPRHCYTPPSLSGPYGSVLDLRPVELGRGRGALFFVTATHFGGPGVTVDLALLDYPNIHDEIEDHLFLEGYLSEISYYDFWNEPSVSDAPILVTANYVWGDEEARIDNHRFIISTYALKDSPDGAEFFSYRLDDRYMTVRKYTSDNQSPVLSSEKPEILARLKRVKAEREREAKASH